MKKLFILIVFITTLVGKNLFADSTFVSGTIVNATWDPTGSPYCVVGDILVAGLTIEPGVEVLFLGNYVFEVGGVLTAIGTEQDSIIFTKVDTVDGWQGIFFNYSSPGSEMAYCLVSGSVNSGIHIDNSAPHISNTTIMNNTSINGGGLYIQGDESITLVSCTIKNNTISGGTIYGAGIYSASPLLLNYCTISDNFADSKGKSYGGGIYSSDSLIVKGCFVSNNYAKAHADGRTYCYGGGISSQAYLKLNNSIVTHNKTYASGNSSRIDYGGGIFFGGAKNVILKNSIISYNTSRYNAGGIYLSVTDSLTLIENCTIAYNNNHGIHSVTDTTDILNSIFYFNTPTQISGNVNVSYSDIQDGYEGEGNIDFHPIFKSEDTLQIVKGSLCIDAGNPDPIYNDIEDPNNPGYALYPSLGGLRNDMGAHGGPGAIGWTDTTTQDTTTIEKEFIKIANKYFLKQNYPNPFNPITHIRFGLPKFSNVRIEIYNLLGQRVAVLLNERKQAGYHTAKFDGSNFSSGVYLYRIQAGEFQQVRKMLLVK